MCMINLVRVFTSMVFLDVDLFSLLTTILYLILGAGNYRSDLSKKLMEYGSTFLPRFDVKNIMRTMSLEPSWCFDDEKV